MFKRTLGALLVLTLLFAPSVAFAAPEVERVEVRPGWVQRVWEELRELFGVEEPRASERLSPRELPRNVSAGEEGGPGHDPFG